MSTAHLTTGPVAWATAGWDSTPSQWSKTHRALDSAWSTLCGAYYGDKEWTGHEGYGGDCQICLRREQELLDAPAPTPTPEPAPTAPEQALATSQVTHESELLPCGHPAEYDALGGCYTCGAQA